MDEETILGQICERRPAGDQQIALLEPLYLFNDKTSSWEPIADVATKFPNRGCVTWLKPTDDAIVGSIWMFTYEQHTSFDPYDQKRDRYRINWRNLPEPMLEVLDLRVADADKAFMRLEQGLNLPFVPTRHVYIVLDSKSWAGPVKLVQQRGRWVLDAHDRETAIDRVGALPEQSLARLKIDGERVFLRPEAPSPMKIGELDWSTDHLVIKRLLTKARKNADINKAFTLTKATIQQIIETLPPSEQQDVTEQQIARARRYLSNIDRFNAELTSFEAELLAMPAVAKRIAAAEAQGRSSAKAQAEAEAVAQAQAELEKARQEHKLLDNTLIGLRASVQMAEEKVRNAEREAQNAIDAEMRQRETELRALDDQIAEQRHKLDSQIALADSAITERVSELVARPAEALAQVAIIRAALGAPHMASAPNIKSSHEIHPPVSAMRHGEEAIEDQQQLTKRLRQALVSVGLAASVGVSVHGALVAGMIPLLSGPSAIEALEQYANVTVGGRMIRINVPPTALEPADLLGRMDIQSGRFVPHPSALLDLLIFASQPQHHDQLFLVVLDGMNRAAADAYLLPLMACYRTAWHEEDRQMLSIAHPSTFAPGDVYATAGQLTWPSNVLLAGTLSDGVARLPLPPSIWVDALFVELGATRNSALASLDSTAKRSAVPLCQWSSWRRLTLSNIQEGLEALNQLNSDDGVRLPVSIARSFARAYTAGQRSLKAEDALRLAVRGSLAPYAITSQQSEMLAQVLEASGAGINEAELQTMQQVLS